MLLQLEGDAFKWSDIDWLASRIDSKYSKTDDVSFNHMFVGIGCLYLMLQSNSTGTYQCVAATFADIAEEFKPELTEFMENDRRDEIDHLAHLLTLNTYQYPCYRLDCFFADAAQYVEERTLRAEAAIQRETKHLGALVSMLNGHAK